MKTQVMDNSFNTIVTKFYMGQLHIPLCILQIHTARTVRRLLLFIQQPENPLRSSNGGLQITDDIRRLIDWP